MNEVKKYVKARNNKVISQAEMINCLISLSLTNTDAVEQAYFNGLLKTSEYFMIVDTVIIRITNPS